MGSDEKIHISPTLLGIVITTVLALIVGGVKYGNLNGRLTLIEARTDFKELNEQQAKLRTSLNKQIIDAQIKLKKIKKDLNTHQLKISTNYLEAENKFNTNVSKILSDASLQVDNLVDTLEVAIKNSSNKKQVILEGLTYGVNNELNRVNKLTKKLKNKLERFKAEIAKKRRRLSSLKIVISELQNEKKSYMVKKLKHGSIDKTLNDEVVEKSSSISISGRNHPPVIKELVVSNHRYFVRMGAFKNKNGANKIKSKLARYKYNATVKKRGDLYRVEIGYYNKSEAYSLRKKLQKNVALMKGMGRIWVDKE